MNKAMNVSQKDIFLKVFDNSGESYKKIPPQREPKFKDTVLKRCKSACLIKRRNIKSKSRWALKTLYIVHFTTVTSSLYTSHRFETLIAAKCFYENIASKGPIISSYED